MATGGQVAESLSSSTFSEDSRSGADEFAVRPSTDVTAKQNTQNANDFLIFVAGGADPDEDEQSAGKGFYSYDPETGKWTQNPDLPAPIDNHGMCAVGPHVFVIGGSNPAFKKETFITPVNTSSMFDSRSNVWGSVAKMRSPRMALECISTGDKIYVFGGTDDKMKITGKVECYCLGTNQWTTMANMKVARKNFGVAIHKKKIWVAGGNTETKDKAVVATDSVEIYDPEENSWQVGVSLPNPSVFVNLCNVRGKLYVVGGIARSKTGKLKVLHKIHVYHDIDNKWVTKTTMKEDRRYFTTAVAGNRIYILGGNNSTNEEKSITDVTCYNVLANEWTYSHSKMPKSTLGMKAATMKKQTSH